jgi:pimeloyl-ACP methyl ester carboxylesterase
MAEVQGNDEQGKPEKHLVILVHGINTFADWMPAMIDTLESAGFLVAPTSFGEMSVSRFLLPFRQKAVQRVLTNIRAAREQHTPHKTSVITHSFGTYVVARILEMEAWPWHRIIFCGSVVPEDFPLGKVRDRFVSPLLNEVGTRDIWPAMAASVTWGYGSIGSHWFNNPTARTRWHDGFRHSDFLTPDFCKKYWIPFLRDGTIIKGSDKPSRLPWTIRAITKIPLRWIFCSYAWDFRHLPSGTFRTGGQLRLIFGRSRVRKNFQFQFITTLRCRTCWIDNFVKFMTATITSPPVTIKGVGFSLMRRKAR